MRRTSPFWPMVSEGKTAPTLAAIRQAFQDIAAQTGEGDFVYLHFSGHGSQAPALNPDDELDGLDELFLPVDIGPWEDSIGTVQNALVDDEIGQLIDSITATGADVWVVFDSCHSGTATRAAGGAADETRLRKLDAAALGVPQDVLDDAETNSRALPDPRTRPDEPVTLASGTAGKGSVTAFFAAQTNETTPEKRLPKGKKGRISQGVFTYTLFETLAERPNITYRQLGQEILRKYGVKNLARSTPMFEGNLDQPVFGKPGGARIQQWPAQIDKTKVTIDAGTLHGLDKGTELLVMASAADDSADALARVRVDSATTFSAVTTVPEIPKGAYLRKASTIVDYGLTVALPDKDSDLTRALTAALDVAKAEKYLGPRIRFVPASEDADLRLALLPVEDAQQDVWLFPSAGYVDEAQLATTPRVRITGKSAHELAQDLSDNFTRIGKALNLLKVAQGAENSTLPVTAEFRTARFDPDAEEVLEDSRAVLDPVKTPRLIPNDVIGVALSNPTNAPVDYNLLYVGADYSITFMDNGRLQPGDKLEEDFVLITDQSFGRDRMLVIVSPAKPQTAVEDLSFMEQSEVPQTRGNGSGIADLLAEAGFGETTRGAVSLSSKKKKKGPQSRIFRLEVDTLPGT